MEFLIFSEVFMAENISSRVLEIQFEDNFLKVTSCLYRLKGKFLKE